MRSGRAVRFEEGQGPVLEPLPEDLGSLDPDGVLERLAPVFETVRLVRAALCAGQGADRLLRRAVDGRDLHDRRARHAGPAAGAAAGARGPGAISAR